MRISRGLVVGLIIGLGLMAMPAFADDATCVDGQCAILADSEMSASEMPRFVAEVPLPPARSQTSIIARQKVTPRMASASPRIVLASARIAAPAASILPLPSREVPKLQSFWLTIGTGF